MEEEEESVKRGSDEEDSDGEAEQKEKKVNGDQADFIPITAAQIGFIDPLL